MVDALAEHPIQINKSPYVYTGNNPKSRIDPDGNCWPCWIVRVAIIKEKSPPNPAGSKCKPDHQQKVGELADKAKEEAKSGETVVTEQKIKGHDSRRRPDVQIVDKKGKTRKVLEADRLPNTKRNKKREQVYQRLGIEQETHKLEVM